MNELQLIEIHFVHIKKKKPAENQRGGENIHMRTFCKVSFSMCFLLFLYTELLPGSKNPAKHPRIRPGDARRQQVISLETFCVQEVEAS